MATTWSVNSYDSVMNEMEKVVKSKYESRLIELEKQNWDLQQKQSYVGMAQQYLPGQIIPNINVNDWYYNQNTCMYEQKGMSAPTKPRDIKSLIAYYYNR